MTKKVIKQMSGETGEMPVEKTAQIQTEETETAKDAVEDNQTGETTEETESKKVIVVLKRFRDKTDHTTMFDIGQELEFEVERANDVVSRGLAKFKNDE